MNLNSFLETDYTHIQITD